MSRIGVIGRIALGLSALAVSLLLAAQTLGLVPDERPAVLDGRRKLAETLAVSCSLFAERGDVARMEAGLRAARERNPELLSVAVRRTDGRVLVELGPHAAHWTPLTDRLSSPTQITVPIRDARGLWGHVELRFPPLQAAGWQGVLLDRTFRLCVFLGCSCLIVYYLYLRRLLKRLDPRQVVPDRVRSALDSLTEGLLLLDREERIVLANRAFADNLGRDPGELMGRKASELPWTARDDGGPIPLPWVDVLALGEARKGVVLTLPGPEQSGRTFVVNASPVFNDRGERRGALASFDDVTAIEKNRSELKRMLNVLQASRDEISKKNEELRVLATEDPLTGCLNRRAFFAEFEKAWKDARVHGGAVGCIMLDVDHFKSVNDQHGHAMGDDVLKKVGAALRRRRDSHALVARYGGEEFCLALPGLDLHAVARLAEELRQTVAALPFQGLTVTASLGVSSNRLGAADLHALLNEADQALYAAKRTGRNRVVRFDAMPDLTPEERKSAPRREARPEEDAAIPYQAVAALLTALTFRDAPTAEHSRRVADLCVAAAHHRMTKRQAYVLEMAALLHDIGKIGVPDAVLLKPGPLGPDEWKVMETHDRMGVDIVISSFACEELTDIIRTHHAWFNGRHGRGDLPRGQDIPLGARLLALADAYDAMVSDRVYRKGRSPEAAFAELRKCAGQQFDPELVEVFIQSAAASDASRRQPATPVAKEAALRIGMEIERLAAALDNLDLAGLAVLSERLERLAGRSHAPDIASTAAELKKCAVNESAPERIIELTSELLALCRRTQNAYLEPLRAAREPEDAPPPTRTLVLPANSGPVQAPFVVV